MRILDKSNTFPKKNQHLITYNKESAIIHSIINHSIIQSQIPMNITSIAIPLPINNIDTDQIIPAKFLKQVDKEGYGQNLFHNWRYLADGSPNPEFELNKPEHQGAEILIAGSNFGSGSSREHAAWALTGYGIKVVVSAKFADIFKGNAYNNGILPIELKENAVDTLFHAIDLFPETQIEVNLEEQTIRAKSIDFEETFQIPAFKKECLLQGVDETTFLIGLREEVAAYEKRAQS